MGVEVVVEEVGVTSIVKTCKFPSSPSNARMCLTKKGMRERRRESERMREESGSDMERESDSESQRQREPK